MRRPALLVIVLIAARFVLGASPSTSPVAATLPSDRFADALNLWADGRQDDAERLLDVGVQEAPNDLKLAFFRVACIRSRFEIKEAFPIFRDIATRYPDSAYGQASVHLMYIDADKNAAEHLKLLDGLASADPKDPLLKWMVAVSCRTLNENELGVRRYDELLKLIAPARGPVLVHQTYANMLDELGRYEDSLPHRKLAVELEPEYWSYDGLGLTLTKLRRWDEVDAAFEKGTSMNPSDPNGWKGWIISMYARGDMEGLKRIRAKRDAANGANGK